MKNAPEGAFLLAFGGVDVLRIHIHGAPVKPINPIKIIDFVEFKA
jgi:hypothetical protein